MDTSIQPCKVKGKKPPIVIKALGCQARGLVVIMKKAQDSASSPGQRISQFLLFPLEANSAYAGHLVAETATTNEYVCKRTKPTLT